jgi:Zn-dependent peptidase ImmA (M78 family)
MNNLAKAAARKILKEYFISEPQKLNLEEILAGELIYLEESNLNGETGRIVFNERCGIMRIDSTIKEVGHRRTVIAHELGHFKLHQNKLKGCTKLELLTHQNNKPQENDANVFAAELLMPEEWIKDFMKGKKPDRYLLSKFCEYFNVSISSAALRISILDIFPVAVIMSKDGIVQWSSISKSFPFKWIPVGYKVNNNSYAYDLFEDMKKPVFGTPAETGGLLSAEENNHCFEEVLADAWFWEDRNYKKNFLMYEYNIPMPAYNSVLTILYLKE